jgi:NAD(P)-dependent dehydrogenase (short-subunit alcohol dehydrogenase family)
VVTGAGGGIGHGIALALAAAGASVVVADVVPERVTAPVRAIEANNGRAVGQVTDVMDPEQIEAAVAPADQTWGPRHPREQRRGVRSKAFLEQSERSCVVTSTST